MPKNRNNTANKENIEHIVAESVNEFAKGDGDIIRALRNATVSFGQEVIIYFPQYWQAEMAKNTTSIKIQSKAGNRTVRYLFEFWENRPSCLYSQSNLIKLLDPTSIKTPSSCNCYSCENGWTYGV